MGIGILRTLISLTACIGMGASVFAQTEAGFYQGKTVQIIVGTGVGGGYDANARLVARHLGRFLPGHPTLVVTNTPGGGGLTAASLLFHRSPRDGTVLGTFSNAMLTEPLLGNGQARFDPTQFTWIGSASHEDGICIAAASSGVTSWDDLLHKELIVGTTAPGTTTFMYPMMLRNLFGARFKLVSGYPDGAQIVLGLERGEVQSICQTYSSLKISRPDWIKDGKVHPIVFLGMERHPELPDLKAIGEMTTRPEQAEMLKVVLAPTVAGRPFVAPPNIPAERASELRAAFAAMVADASFREDAQKMRIEVEPSTAQQIEELVKNIYALSPDLIAQLKTAVGGSAPQ